MQFGCQCEKPLIIYNKTMRRWITVRCGRCQTCKKHTINLKRTQAQNANTFFKYMAMITLTYDENKLPTKRIFNDGKHIGIDGKVIDIDEKIEKNLKQLCTKFKGNKFQRVKDIKEVKELPIIKTKDVQNWMKRLRKKIPNASLKYMVLGEYGGITLRPHYHVIIWSNELGTMRYLKNSYHNKWGKGRTSWQGMGPRRERHRDNVAQYVANYVCSSRTLSVLYEPRDRRPKIWGSCGLYVLNYKKDLGAIYRSPFDYFNNQVDSRTGVKRTFNSNICYSILPRCRHFNELPSDCRTKLYKATNYTSTEEIYQRATTKKQAKKTTTIKEETIQIILFLLNTEITQRKLKYIRNEKGKKEASTQLLKKNEVEVKQAIRSILNASKQINKAAENTGLTKDYLIAKTIDYQTKRDSYLLTDKLKSLEGINNELLNRVTYYTAKNQKKINENNRERHQQVLQAKTSKLWKIEIENLHAKMYEKEKHRDFNEKILINLGI